MGGTHSAAREDREREALKSLMLTEGRLKKKKVNKRDGRGGGDVLRTKKEWDSI